MATLSVDTPRVYETGHDEMIAGLPMIDNDIIYEGAAVGESTTSGTFRPLQSGDNFGGFCTANTDNTGTGHAAAAVSAPVKRKGVVKLAVTGASALTDEGASVFATDDDTFTLTPSGTRIGKVAKWLTGTSCMVAFDADAPAVRETLQIPVDLHASKTEYNLYTATVPVRVVSIKYVPDVAQGGALTGTVVKVDGTATPVKTTTPMHTADGVNFNGTAHTVQAITLSTTVADLALVAGQRIGLDLSAALTTGSGLLTIGIERI